MVQLPGVQDTAQAKRILGATATLNTAAWSKAATCEAATTATCRRTRACTTRATAPTKPIPVLLKKRVIVSGDQLVGAQSTRSTGGRVRRR